MRRTNDLIVATRVLVLCAALLTCKDGTGPGAVTVDRIVVAGPSTVHIGYPRSFQAYALAAGGDTLQRTFAWTSSDTLKASVSTTGSVFGKQVGDVVISASVDGKLGTTSVMIRVVPVGRVDVTPTAVDSLFVGDSVQMSAIVLDSALYPVTGRIVTWLVSDSGKARVTSQGLVHTLSAGSFTVTAHSEGKTGGVFLNAQLRVASLVMPDSLAVGRRHRVRLIPDFRSESGTHLARRSVTWQSSAPNVVAVDPTGLVTPQAIGRATIRVEGYGFRDSVLILVTPEAVAAILLEYEGPYPPPIDTAALALKATPYDSSGLPAEGNEITWSSADTSVARIEANPVNSWQAVITVRRPLEVNFTAASGNVSNSFIFTFSYPPVTLRIVPDSLVIPAGESRYFYPIGLDRFGRRVGTDPSERFVTVLDTSVARVENVDPTMIRAYAPGRTPVIVRLSTGLTDTAIIVVQSTNNYRLRWATEYIAPGPYSTTTAVLRAFDSTGSAVTVPHDVQIVSSDTSILVPVSGIILGMTAEETVTVKSRAPGAAALIAVTDSSFASLFVPVGGVVPKQVYLSDSTPIVATGDTLRLRATVQGTDLRFYEFPVNWRSTDPSLASVTDSGLVLGIQPGRARIIASSQSRADTAFLTVQSPDGPVINRLGADTLVPGTVLVIHGSGYGSDITTVAVEIEGVAAEVIETLDTSVTVLLPATPSFPCRPTHFARILLTVNGRLTVDSAIMRVATPRSVSIGEALTLSGATAWCTELPAGTFYQLIAANASGGTSIPFQFRVWGGGPAANTAPPDAGPWTSPSSPSTQPEVRLSLDSLRRAAAVHRRLIEGARRLALRVGPLSPLLRSSLQLRPSLSVTATIGGIAEVRVPRLEDSDFCASYSSIRARIAYTGMHVTILEDVAAPLAGTMDADYRALGEEFDNVMYPKVLEYFGNPLALDSLLDANGRIAMLFTPRVNQYGVGGFVVSCDFYPESVAPSSNTGEIFYGPVPLHSGSGYSLFTRDVWRWLIRAIAMHETKHLAAFAERLSRGAPLEETWIEEGSAVLAEELWSRGIYGTAWKSNANYQQTLHCDVRPTLPACAGRPYAMFNAFAFFYDYLARLNRRTPLGPQTFDDASFYGSSWALLRWTIDHYAASEADFLKALTQEPILTGLGNLESRIGSPFTDWLPEWGYALHLDSWGQAAPRPTLTFPGWDLQNIFVSMSTNFPTDFPDGHPIRPPVILWDVVYSMTLPAGGWQTYGGFSGIVEARAGDGSPLPSTFRFQLNRTF
jgi:uncharacterized protein YjdB